VNDISGAASLWQPRIRYSKPVQTPATLGTLWMGRKGRNGAEADI